MIRPTNASQPNVQVGQEVLYIPAICTQHAHGVDPIPARVLNIHNDGSLDVILLPEKFHEEPRFYAIYTPELIADSDWCRWHEVSA